MVVTAAFDPARWMPRRDENLLEYWISFSPMAPMMGVRWRFADVMEIAVPDARPGPRPPIRGEAGDAEVVAETPAEAVARAAAQQPAGAADAAVQTVMAAADMARKAAETAPAPPAPAAAPATYGASGAAATPPAPAAAKPGQAAPAASAAKAEAAPAQAAANTEAEPAQAAPKAEAAPANAAPKAEAAQPRAAPKAEAAQPKAAAPQPKDDLTMIKGIGPKAAENLAARGITRFAQIAAWSERDVDEVEASLGGVPGRIRRDDWIGQARRLAG